MMRCWEWNWLLTINTQYNFSRESGVFIVSKEKKVFNISSGSPVQSTAGSIVKSYEDGFEVELRAIGAGAVNQMYKSCGVARGILASKGRELSVKPGFDTTKIDGQERTVLVAQVVIVG